MSKPVFRRCDDVAYIARIERAAPDVSLDQLLRTFPAAGGKIVVNRLASWPVCEFVVCDKRQRRHTTTGFWCVYRVKHFMASLRELLSTRA